MKWRDLSRDDVMHLGSLRRNAEARHLAGQEDGAMWMTGDTLMIRLDGVIYDCLVRRWVVAKDVMDRP